MKLLWASNSTHRAWTLIELLVVLGVIAILAAMVDFGPSPRAKRLAKRVQCVSNLKEIGLAYRIRGGDSEPDLHIQVPVRAGGVKELVESGNALASYLAMSNEITSPKILVCPSDKNRITATNFPIVFDRQNLSYFVGVDATDVTPDSWLSGDDNLEVDGTVVKTGLFQFSSNAPIVWTSARHVFSGNIGLADGSVQSANNTNLLMLVNQTGLATNRLAIP